MKKEHGTNYQMLFIMGITFTGAGIAIGFPALMVLGLVFMAIGLTKRSQWPDKKNQDSSV